MTKCVPINTSAAPLLLQVYNGKSALSLSKQKLEDVQFLGVGILFWNDSYYAPIVKGPCMCKYLLGFLECFKPQMSAGSKSRIVETS